VKHVVPTAFLQSLIVGLLAMSVILCQFIVIGVLVAILVIERSLALLTSSVPGSHCNETA
jgi:hypothetical protein